MSYTPPSGDAADFSWVGVAAYMAPDGDAADFSWAGASAPDAVEGNAAAAVASLALTGEVLGAFGAVTGTAAATLATISLTGQVMAAAGAAGSASAQVAFLDLTGLVTAQLVTAGPAAATIATIALTGAITAQHPRYELRGQVRLAGSPVERRVRAYRRDTGVLLGQGDTTGGFFRIPAGFAAIECTVLPIDLSPGATDYEPPTANRVLCVMAEDEA